MAGSWAGLGTKELEVMGQESEGSKSHTCCPWKTWMGLRLEREARKGGCSKDRRVSRALQQKPAQPACAQMPRNSRIPVDNEMGRLSPWG